MKYGVIVCPHCKYVKGIFLSAQTTKCIRCGKTLQRKKLKIFYETDSQEKLRQAIGLMNAQLNEKTMLDKKFLFDNGASK
jgi:DNA-directed RNA polymerase subunit RPC12/RpoP